MDSFLESASQEGDDLLAGTPSFMEDAQFHDEVPQGEAAAAAAERGLALAEVHSSPLGELSIPLTEESLRPPGFSQQLEEEEDVDEAQMTSSRPLVTSPAAPSSSAAPARSVAAASDGIVAYTDPPTNDAVANTNGAQQPQRRGDVFSHFGLRSGFALRNYEEELGRIKKENLQLRLRIYLLEERHGLLPEKGKAGEENIFRCFIKRAACYLGFGLSSCVFYSG